jgi:hypothetical protein
LDKFAAIQMLDVHFPTTDGRTLILSRYTYPEPDHKILLEQLKLTLPPQPPTTDKFPRKALEPELKHRSCGTDLLTTMSIWSGFPSRQPLELLRKTG